MPASPTSTHPRSARKCICRSVARKPLATAIARAALARLTSTPSGSRFTSTTPTSCRRRRSTGKTKTVHPRGHRERRGNRRFESSASSVPSVVKVLHSVRDLHSPCLLGLELPHPPANPLQDSTSVILFGYLPNAYRECWGFQSVWGSCYRCFHAGRPQ